MHNPVRTALITGILAIWVGASACGPAAPSSNVAPTPLAAASTTPSRSTATREPPLRFPRPEWGDQELRAYSLTQRMLMRGIDVATGAVSEQASSLARLEHTSALPGGRFETTVLSDVESQDERTPGVKHRTHPSYTVTTDGEKVSVVTKPGAVLDPEHEKGVIERAKGRDALGVVLDFLAQQPLERGVAVPLPPPMLALLGGGERGTATLVAVEDRWQRKVARLSLELSRAATPDRPLLRGDGDLYVEAETGRPILLTSQVRKSRKWKEGGRDVDVRAFDSSDRRWGFIRKDALARSSFSADPAPSAIGDARQIVISPDEGSAAVLLDRPTGGELAIWDLGRRAVRESRASDARFVLLDSLADSTVLYEVGAHAVTSRVFFTGGLQPFGTVMLMDRTFDPSAAAATGPWVAVGGSDGRVTVAEPRFACMLGAFPSGLSSIRAMAFAAKDRLVLVDKDGQVAVMAVEQVGGKANVALACATTSVRATPKERLKLPFAATRLDAHAGTLLFTAPSGDVVAWTGTGPPRPLRPARPPRHGVVAIAPSGRFGLSAEGQVVSLFEPGQTRDAARLETFASPVVGVVAHGTTVVAASYDGNRAQVASWDLRAASARVEKLGSGEVTLSATADGARHVLAAADRVDVRETATGAVVRSWARQALAASGAPLGATLGKGGLSLAIRRPDGAVVVQDVATGRPVAELAAGSANGASSFVLSPTEDLLLSVGSDGRLVGTELLGRRVRFAVEATKAATASPGAQRVAVSADGAWIAVAGTHREGSGWNPAIPVVEIRSTRDGSLVVGLSPTWAKVTSMAFTNGNELLVAGTDEGRLLTWDTASGLLLHDRPAHDRAITSLFAPSSGSVLWSASADGSVRLWDPRAHEEPKRPGAIGIVEEALAPWRPTRLVATLMVDTRGDAVAATGDGYYKADRGSLRTLTLTSGPSRYEFQQFDALLHRPDLVIERLGGGDDGRLAMFRAAHAKRAQVLRGTMPQSLPKPPKLTLTQRLPLLTKDRSLALGVGVEAGEGALQTLHVAVNSVPVGPVGGTPLSGATWSGDVALTLGAGANRVEVYATDARGAASQIESHVIEYTGPTSPASLYAVVVGVSKYANSKLDLDYAAKDARDVGALLGASKRFAKVQVHEILDLRATRAEILAARAFLEKAGVDDTVVVFMAGHGMLDRNLDYWFATTDIDPKAPARSGLGYEQLTSLVTGLAARRRVVLLDTCHAGEADKTTDAAWAPPKAGAPAKPHVKRFRGLELERPVPDGQSFGLMQQLFTDLRAGSGAIVLGSAGGAELALESDRYKNGVFTFALLEALKESRGDVDRDGQVTATELVRYVRSRVEELTRGVQRPATRGENLDLDFPIY